MLFKNVHKMAASIDGQNLSFKMVPCLFHGMQLFNSYNHLLNGKNDSSSDFFLNSKNLKGTIKSLENLYFEFFL